MSYILSLDQGTTSSRSVVVDAQGRIVGMGQQEISQHFPQAGWVEHQPREIWQSQLMTIQQALEQAQIQAKDIAAIGITNQRETTILWDKATGEPLHNALVWQDRRTSNAIDALKAKDLEEKIRQRTGLVLDAYFSASKIAWLLDNVTGARRKAEAGELLFGTVDSWLLWNLTGGAVHASDVSNASRTLLFNIHTLMWDSELLDIFDIPAAMLPEVQSSSLVFGEVATTYLPAEYQGLAGIAITGMAGDQQAASFAQGCFRKGMGKNTYGTGCFLLMNTGEQAVNSQHRLLSTVAWQLGYRKVTYALEGSVFMAGAIVQWLRDNLGFVTKSEEIEALSRSVPDSDGVYLVPAFTGLGAPYWNQNARASLQGLTRGSHKGHIARAALESIAYQVHDVAQAMQADAGMALEQLRVDGGAAKNDLLLQFQADILDTVIIRPKVTESTALGAAYLAGLAIDYWQDSSELEALWQEDRRFEPQMSEDERQTRLAGWHKAVERSKDWLEDG